MLAKIKTKLMVILDEIQYHIGGLVQERRNSGALAIELRLSCINPSIYNNHITSGILET